MRQLWTPGKALYETVRPDDFRDVRFSDQPPQVANQFAIYEAKIVRAFIEEAHHRDCNQHPCDRGLYETIDKMLSKYPQEGSSTGHIERDRLC